MAKELGCQFLNTQLIIETSKIDALHLEEGAHEKLGEAIAAAVKGI